jgi:transposase-like protein
MSRRPRRNHSAAFKAKVALEAVMGDRTIAEIAQKHHVHPNQVTEWRRQLLERAIGVFAHQGGIAERKEMIDRGHDLPIKRQAELLNISRGTVYYHPSRPAKRIEALRGLFMSLKGGGISTMRTALPHEERARVAALCAVLPQRGTLKNSAVSWGAWVMSSISSRPLGVQEAHGLAESSHRSALHHVLRALVCR